MNPYGVDTSESNTLGPLMSLNILYNEMPATTGCGDCAKINGEDNKDWCCRKHNPSMYYCEFLKVFKLFTTWSKSKRTEFILRAVKNYLSNSLSKGCIFYKDGCQCYSARPLSCRLYGVIPQESWDRRHKILQDRYGDQFQPVQQCSLVKSKTPVTVEMEHKWFLHTKKCEERLGVVPNAISLHDSGGGSYRTFHDHLLIELFPDSILSHLTKIRLTNPTEEQIDSAINAIADLLANDNI